MPTERREVWHTDDRKLSSECPESIRPSVEVVIDSMIGTYRPACFMALSAACSAINALFKSHIVSIRRISTPPAIRAVICSVYALSNVSVFDAIVEQLIVVGPIDPATNRGLSGVDWV